MEHESIRRIKDKTGNFSIILNEVFQRPDLSARAKGVYAYIMTLPDNWILHKGELYSHFTEGRDSLNSAWKELENSGLVMREVVRDPKSGRLSGSRYTVFESPQCRRVTEKPETGFSESRINRQPVFPQLLNTNSNKLLNKQTTTTPADENKAPQASAPPEKKQSEASAAVVDLKNNLKSINPELVFDSAFYNNAASFLSRNKLDSAYLNWLYSQCVNKKPRSLSGLYFKLFFLPHIAEAYLSRENQPPKTAPPPLVCPVCGAEHKRGGPCPSCGLPADYSKRDVILFKKLYAMPPDKRALYETRENRIISDFKIKMDFNLFAARRAALNQEFGIDDG
jgi:hypothetical protein